MVSDRRIKRREGGGERSGFAVSVLVAVIALGMAVAACGATGSTSTTGTAARGNSKPSVRPTGAVTIRTVTGRDGTYLADGSGRALYMWEADDVGKSNCSADCALAWPPLITSARPSVSGGARSADVGMITRADRTKQVTYKGHPLYYFAVDSGAGTTKGQGSDSFGARWWLLSPAGNAITVNGGSSVSPPTGY
jgi:predicted lipoprotein with Yx(FWY)xxD motif